MTQQLKDALNNLELEVIHYRNTGVGKTFLFAAFERVKALSCYQDKEDNRQADYGWSLNNGFDE